MIAKVVERQSGIELLRIIAMFMVLVLHVYYAVGLSGATTPFEIFSRILVESLAIVSVDVFVLISGWFGITFKIKRIGGFLFQCLFFSIIVSIIIWLIKGMPHMDVKSIVGTLFIGKSYYWFVKCYLLLYVLSPVLNSFIDNADENKVGLIVLLFFVIMLIYGWSDSMPEFQSGYSCISFVGLYLLARYVRKYCKAICNKPSIIFAAIYIISSLLMAMIYFMLNKINAPYEITRFVFSYDNPLVIAGAMSIVLLFSKIDFTSSIVNKVAKSSFSVYLLHSGPIAWPLYLSVCNQISRSFAGSNMYLVMFIFLVGVFILAIIIDQIRLIIWNYLFEKSNNE